MLMALLLAGMAMAQTSPGVAPPGGAQSVVVQVAAKDKTGRLKSDRKLTVPVGYAIEVYARIPQARFMVVAPDGDLLVAQPEGGKKKFKLRRQQDESGTIYRVHGANGAHAQVTEYASGLRLPHGLAFHDLQGRPYLYVAESDAVVRFAYGPGAAGAADPVISGLPSASLPELHGAYGHELKNITFGPDNKLYVDFGSTCNVCVSDTVSNPKRAAIYVYDENGKDGRLFAQGIRNGEGVRFFPGTSELWVTVNGRDDMPDPKTGKVSDAFVDDHPPDSLLLARDGGNYGWPFCQPSQDTASGFLNMPFVLDVNLNKDGHIDCSKMDKHALGFEAHSAALGLEFVKGSLVGDKHEWVALVGLRGSWNRSRKTGYKIVYVPFNAQWRPEQQQPVNLVTGWLENGSQSEWGRPVDAVAGKDGSIFISDDTSGTVYRLYRQRS